MKKEDLCRSILGGIFGVAFIVVFILYFNNMQNESSVNPPQDIEWEEPLKAEVKNKPEVEVKARESVVHRFFKSDDKYDSQYSVRLMDGKVLKTVLNTKLGTPDDFFFLREGDTVVYSGDKVIEIRFKREAQ